MPCSLQPASTERAFISLIICVNRLLSFFQLRSEVQMRTGNLSKEEINDIGFDRFAVNTADKDELDMATDEGSSSSKHNTLQILLPFNAVLTLLQKDIGGI